MDYEILDGKNLLKAASDFRKVVVELKSGIDDIAWYPYDSLSNFVHLEDFFNLIPLSELAESGEAILDIGAADGEVAFLLEKLGYVPNIIDYSPTNHNNLNGAKTLSRKLDSKINIFDFDLDSYGALHTVFPNPVSVTFLLGIHYHLKNPFLILDFLSQKTEYLYFSTRIARYTPKGYQMELESLSYLLGPNELNNDATNYWVFSKQGIMKLFDRAGFEVIQIKNVGDLKKSVPDDINHDERLFALLRSKNYIKST